MTRAVGPSDMQLSDVVALLEAHLDADEQRSTT